MNHESFRRVDALRVRIYIYIYERLTGMIVIVIVARV